MDDNNELRIEIHHNDELMGWGVAITAIVFIVWLAMLFKYPSIGSLIGFVVIFAPIITLIVIHEKRPTVVTANDDIITCKYLFSTKTIKLSAIEKLTCEPYSVRGRYETFQRIKLTITTLDGEEYELNDQVDANKMLNDKLESKETDVPLIRLNNFLKEKTML